MKQQKFAKPFKSTLEYLKTMKQEFVVIQENNHSGYVPGRYKYYSGHWHFQRDGLWYPIGDVKSLTAQGD